MADEKKKGNSCEVFLTVEEEAKLFHKKLNRDINNYNQARFVQQKEQEVTLEELKYSNAAMLGTIQELRQRNKELEELVSLLRVENALLKN